MCLNWTLAAFCLKIGMFQPGSSPVDLFHRDGQADLKLETVRKPVDLADLADLAPSVSFEFLELGLVSSLPFRVSIGK